MKFGEYIRQKRLDENLSLRKFCEVLKFDPSNWSKVERGRMPLTVDDEKLSELASILKINESEEENKFFL